MVRSVASFNGHGLDLKRYRRDGWWPGCAGCATSITPRAITQTIQYFTGLRGMYAAYDAVDDILSNWG